MLHGEKIKKIALFQYSSSIQYLHYFINDDFEDPDQAAQKLPDPPLNYFKDITVGVINTQHAYIFSLCIYTKRKKTQGAQNLRYFLNRSM